MKLTENTKVRIKVPKHLYESIQAELAKKQEMEESEQVQEGDINEFYGLNPNLDIITLALGAGVPIAAAAASLIQQVGFKGVMDLLKKSDAPKEDKAELEKAVVAAKDGGEISEVTVGGKTPGLNLSKNDTPNRQYSKEDLKQKLISISKQVNLMKGLGSAEIGAFAKLLDDLMAKLNDPANLANQVKTAGKTFANLTKNIKAEEVEELEETLDFETLMEAVKDAAKKKAEEKKKKEAEAKKKAEADKKK